MSHFSLTSLVNDPANINVSLIVSLRPSVSAGAMKAMVSKDIVHRDLKPQNILLSHDGKTKNPRPEDMKLKIGKYCIHTC